jgi:hypothetical protein
MNNLFAPLKIEIQSIIDNIAIKNVTVACQKLIEVSNSIDLLIDVTTDEEILVELTKYQLLLNHLQLKMSIKED